LTDRPSPVSAAAADNDASDGVDCGSGDDIVSSDSVLGVLAVTLSSQRIHHLVSPVH